MGAARAIIEMMEQRQLLAAEVACVPWQFDLAHEALNSSPAILKAVVNGSVPISYTWDFGDGSTPATGTVTSDAQRYQVERGHIYSGTDGTPYTATLSIIDHDGNTASDTYKIVMRDDSLAVRTNIAIDTGLWWWHKNITRTTTTVGGVVVPLGSWLEGGYAQSLTGLAVLAFENQAHLASGDASQDPYVDDVVRGLNYLFSRMTSQSISGPSAQCPAGNPDTNGNGIGLSVAGDRYTYEIGPAMMAIAASGTPDVLAPCGVANVYNRSYRDILTDLVDMCAWGQNENSVGRGGWRYAWNYPTSDNSIVQWPMLGMAAAEEHWGVTPPDFVKREVELWLNYSQYANGGWMYMADYPNSDDHAHAGAGIFALDYLGYPASDPRIQNALSWLNTNWNASVWTSQPAKTIWENKYGMYAVMKGLRSIGATTVGTHDWYTEFCTSLLSTYYYGGYWGKTSTWTSGYMLDSIFSLLTLEPTIASPPPVSVLHPVPQQAQPGQVFTFDGSSSYHLDSGRTIVQYEWDFGDGTTYTETAASAPDGAFDGIATHAFSDTVDSLAALPGQQHTYVVTQTVTDDDPSGAKTSVATREVTLSLQNHPPVSDPGGPYIGYVGLPVTLSGIGSYDPDPGAPLYNHIASYAWELEGVAPYDFADGNTVAVNRTWNTPGVYNVALKVTDSYGAEAITWTTVEVRVGVPTVTFVRADQDGHQGQPGQLEARLTDPTGAPLPGMSLQFYFDANKDNSIDPVTEFVGTGTTDAFGDAYVPYTPMVAPDYYLLHAQFAGSGDFLASQHTNLLHVKAAAAVSVVSLTVNQGAVQRSMVNQLLLTFDGPVNPSTLGGGGVTLARRNSGGSGLNNGSAPTDVTAQMVISNPSGDGMNFVIRFSGPGTDPGASLADGIYDLAVHAGVVTDATGQPIVADKTFTFHRLFGDATGDKKVDWYDVMPFSGTYGKTSASNAYVSYFDFEGNGSVLLTDYRELLKRINRKLVY